MKKKIFFGVATLFFAVATMFNMNMVQGSRAGDVSLDNVTVMAQAYGDVLGAKGLCCHINPNECVYPEITIPGNFVY